jgi:hypothetical protein
VVDKYDRQKGMTRRQDGAEKHAGMSGKLSRHVGMSGRRGRQVYVMQGSRQTFRQMKKLTWLTWQAGRRILNRPRGGVRQKGNRFEETR